jgi:hypothetical protein
MAGACNIAGQIDKNIHQACDIMSHPTRTIAASCRTRRVRARHRVAPNVLIAVRAESSAALAVEKRRPANATKSVVGNDAHLVRRLGCPRVKVARIAPSASSKRETDREQ